jgi:hypothetical protein
LPGTNALAYHEKSYLTAVKSFITLATGELHPDGGGGARDRRQVRRNVTSGHPVSGERRARLRPQQGQGLRRRPREGHRRRSQLLRCRDQERRNWRAGEFVLGAMTFNSMTAGRMTVGRMTVSRMTVGRMTVVRMTVGRMTVSRMTVKRMSQGKMTIGRMTEGRMLLS